MPSNNPYIWKMVFKLKLQYNTNEITQLFLIFTGRVRHY
jgi:hypothetical protein